MTVYPNGLVKSLLPVVDQILGVRDSIGAVIQPVSFLTRTFYLDAAKTLPAKQPEGKYATDVVVQMLPTPSLKAFAQDIRLREGGAIKSGDLILKGVSGNKFKQSDLDGSSPAPNVLKLFLVGDKLYQVVNVSQRYVTFDVQIRELTNQRRY